MAAPQVHHLANAPLTAHAFNATRDALAVSQNSNLVSLYHHSSSSPHWSLNHTLSDHDKIITSIDWAPQSNRIVTASKDRNADVWNPTLLPHSSQLSWIPTLVLVRLNRSATFVRWSPNESKFAVASGSRTIAVCTFDIDSDWWVSKHIRKPFRSTVMSVAWHPNSILLASGTLDGACDIVSGYIKGIDQKPIQPDHHHHHPWPEKLPFGSLCKHYTSPCGGWVTDACFGVSNHVDQFVAFVSHDSSVTIVYPAPTGDPNGPADRIQVIKLACLPLISLAFVHDGCFVAAGHDGLPLLFKGDATNGWKCLKSLDEKNKSLSNSPSTTTHRSSVSNSGATIGRLNQSEAFNMFRAADSKGISSSIGQHQHHISSDPTGAGLIETIHQNTITSVRFYDEKRVSTSGVDGRLVIWDVTTQSDDTLGHKFKAMGLVEH